MLQNVFPREFQVCVYVWGAGGVHKLPREPLGVLVNVLQRHRAKKGGWIDEELSVSTSICLSGKRNAF